ncbi:MAG: putative zinc-binding protein [Candidatus Hadarchaeaceae archaeon]
MVTTQNISGFIINWRKVSMNAPKIGLLTCNSGSSNSGTLTGIAAMEVIKEFSSDLIGICSLPALANEIPRQVLTVKDLKHLIIVDGCRNSCAMKVADKLSLSHDGYVNLEDDLKIWKLGPFSTFQYSDEDVNKVKEAIRAKINQFSRE